MTAISLPLVVHRPSPSLVPQACGMAMGSAGWGAVYAHAYQAAVNAVAARERRKAAEAYVRAVAASN